MKVYAAHIFAHVGLIILGIAATLSIVALCAPHWNGAEVEVETGNQMTVVMGLWRTCTTTNYDGLFFYRVFGWTHCISSHGSEGARAAAVLQLLSFLGLVVAVLFGVVYLFFFYRRVARWLLLGTFIFIVIGAFFGLVALAVWGTNTHQDVAELWESERFSASVGAVGNWWWGWAFVLAIIAFLLAVISAILILLAVLFHKKIEGWPYMMEKTTVTSESYSNGKITSTKKTKEKTRY